MGLFSGKRQRGVGCVSCKGTPSLKRVPKFPNDVVSGHLGLKFQRLGIVSTIRFVGRTTIRSGSEWSTGKKEGRVHRVNLLCVLGVLLDGSSRLVILRASGLSLLSSCFSFRRKYRVKRKTVSDGFTFTKTFLVELKTWVKVVKKHPFLVSFFTFRRYIF